MRIKSQFVLLLAGILVMPLLSIAFFVLYGYYLSSDRTEVPTYAQISSITSAEIDKSAWERITRYIARKPKQFEHVVLDSTGRVLYSTIPEFALRYAISSDEFVSLVRKEGDRYLWQLETVGDSESTAITVFTQIERRKHRPPDPFMKIFAWVLTLIGMIFAFASAMIVAIARSISRSVTKLEESTRRIANGELDTPVDITGSNEITSLAGSLNRMRVALKEENSRKARFIMGISHDLKTPLALIKGYTEAISDGFMEDPATMAKTLSLVEGKVDQLGGMIDDLIGYVKLDSGEWRKTFRMVDLGAIVGAAVTRMAEDVRLFDREISLQSALSGPSPVSMDERLFLRAFENIVNNAIRYTETGGKILVAARETGAGYELSVSDDGCGISETDLPHIFELFYRGSPSRREEGMGLGLSVVKSVIDSHGWKVSVNSRQGLGTTVTIAIPPYDTP